MVADYYIGTEKYVAAPGAPVIAKDAKHALQTQIGAGSAPATLIPVKNPEEGVRMVMRQLVDHMLNDLAKDPGFAPGPKTAGLAPLTRFALLALN